MTYNPIQNLADGCLDHASPSEHTLVRYASRGVFRGIFHASGGPRATELVDIAKGCRPEIVAVAAVLSRARRRGNGLPGLLVAWLCTMEPALAERVFSHVVDDGATLSDFVMSLRSGAVGRRSLGAGPKRLVEQWFAARSPEVIFRQSIGARPSMADVIKMAHPPPRSTSGAPDAAREALYGYLIGNDVDGAKLPHLVRDFEQFRRDGGRLPDVPLEMFLSSKLAPARWKSIAREMTFTQLCTGLVTLARHAIFDDAELGNLIADKLRDVTAVRSARAMPFGLLTTYRATLGSVPSPISIALKRATVAAMANTPALPGRVVVCPDVSGSMHQPMDRGVLTRAHVAELVCASVRAHDPSADILPFDEAMCSAPLHRLDMRGDRVDVLIVVSDARAWPAAWSDKWTRIRHRNPGAKLVLIDLEPGAATGQTERQERGDVLLVCGFSDQVFDLIASFAREPVLEA